MQSLLKNILIIFVLSFLGFLMEDKTTLRKLSENIKPKIPSSPLVFLIPILLLATILRFWNLAKREFWYDEAFSSIIVRQSWEKAFEYIKIDIHPPLYYLGLKTWTAFFEYSDFALRSFSTLFGILLVFLVYKFAIKLLGDKTKAFIVSLVFAVNPFLIQYSQETRSYALLVFLIIGIVFTLYSRRWIVLSALISLTFMTHYITVFLIPSIILIIVVYNIYNKRIILPSILSLIVPLTVFVLWLPILKDHWGTGVKGSLLGWIPKANIISFPQSIQEFLFGTNASEPKVILLSLVIVLISIYAFVKSTRKERFDLFYLLAMSLPPIIGIVFTSMYLNINLYVTRVLIGFLAVFLIYLVLVISKLHKYVALSILVVYTSLTLSMHKEIKNPGYRQLAEYAISSPRMLVMTDPMMYGTLSHYLNKTTRNHIKLQESYIGRWPLIFPEDIIIRSEMKEPFYLVHLGPIADWDYLTKVGDFYLYEWFPN